MLLEYGSICVDSALVMVVAGAAGPKEITGDDHQNNLFVCCVWCDMTL